MMHSNAALLQRLYTGLNQHDHETMAGCYHSEATFRDIAFTLEGTKHIHAMWHMICETDIRATFDNVRADDLSGQVNLCDDYTFSSTGRSVHNVIDSQFRFRNGLIIEHHDFCDPRAWAKMALGGTAGFLAGSFRFLRAWKARKMLDDFVKRHPQYK